MRDKSIQPVHHEPMPAETPEDAGTMLTLTARMLDGEGFTCTVNSRDTVATLKQVLEQQSCIPYDQQEVLLDSTVLNDAWVLSEHGVSGEADITLINKGPVPDYAKEMGLARDHPDLLRAYHARHELNKPEFLTSDEAIWEELRRSQEAYNEARDSLKGYNSFVRLMMVNKPTIPAAALYLAPGESIQVTVSGFIYNNAGNTCIHQLLLALDTKVIAELHDGVPRGGRKFSKNVKLVAPRDPGCYMLWKSNHLQYTMADAKREFQAKTAIVKEGQYPSRFVGWIVVQ